MTVARRVMARVGLCGIVLAVLSQAGCAMLGGGGHYGGVEFISEPAGAQVINLKDDTVVATTPARVWFPGEKKQAEQLTVKFRKPGFQEKITSFWLNMRHDSAENAMADAMPVRVELQEIRP